jgi:hypothetical protein
MPYLYKVISWASNKGTRCGASQCNFMPHISWHTVRKKCAWHPINVDIKEERPISLKISSYTSGRGALKELNNGPVIKWAFCLDLTAWIFQFTLQNKYSR